MAMPQRKPSMNKLDKFNFIRSVIILVEIAGLGDSRIFDIQTIVECFSTGNKDVDTLTVIAHDNFQKVIDEANKGDSLLKRVSFIELDEHDDRDRGGRVENTPTSTEQKIRKQFEKVKGEISEKSKQYVTQVGKAVESAITDIAAEGVASFGDLQNDGIKQKLREKAVAAIKESVKGSLFSENSEESCRPWRIISRLSSSRS